MSLIIKPPLSDVSRSKCADKLSSIFNLPSSTICINKGKLALTLVIEAKS